MHSTRRKLVAAISVAAVLVVAVAGGRHLLTGSSSTSGLAKSASIPVQSNVSKHGVGASSEAPVSSSSSGALQRDALPPTASSAGKAGTSSAGSDLAAVPMFPTTPQVVHTASVDLRVGKGKLDAVLRSMTALAGLDGGYVDSSSVSGGTARRSPVSGTIVMRVPDSDFADAISEVAKLGTVDAQKINGKDVTIQSAQNTASIFVLQSEVSLLEKKLGQTTDINTFLQIEDQLFPVEQQLQRLESAEAVLQNSAALASVTVHLSAPGAVLVSSPTPRPSSAAVTVAWRYLRHNSLAVLDALAVAGGWALPVLVLLALVGFVAQRVVRRHRRAVTPA